MAPERSGPTCRWGLHPALLDVATSFGRGQGDGTYLPLSYGRIVVRGPLPTVFHSHLRHRASTTDEVVAADLSLTDTEGGNSSRSATSCCAGSTRARSPAG